MPHLRLQRLFRVVAVKKHQQQQQQQMSPVVSWKGVVPLVVSLCMRVLLSLFPRLCYNLLPLAGPLSAPLCLSPWRLSLPLSLSLYLSVSISVSVMEYLSVCSLLRLSFLIDRLCIIFIPSYVPFSLMKNARALQ